MINIRLYGHLGEKFRGPECDGSWILDVKTPREALLAIEANSHGQSLRKYLIDSDKFGVGYRVVLDNKEIDCLEQIYVNGGNLEYQTIDIIPEVVGGSSAGIWGIVAGVVLIIVGIILEIPSVGTSTTAVLEGAGLTAGAAAAVVAGAATALIGVGLSLAIGGLEGLLFPPGQAGTSTNKPSNIFSGQVNTTGQGGAIPTLYGEYLIGSQLISAYLTSIEIDPQSGDPIEDDDPTNPADAVNSVWAELNGRTTSSGSSSDPDYDGTYTTGGMAGGLGRGDVVPDELG